VTRPPPRRGGSTWTPWLAIFRSSSSGLGIARELREPRRAGRRGAGAGRWAGRRRHAALRARHPCGAPERLRPPRSLALELAARFYAAGGFDRIAKAYLRDARSGYRQWGAEGKVRQLERSIRIWQTNRLARTRNARWPHRDTWTSRCSKSLSVHAGDWSILSRCRGVASVRFASAPIGSSARYGYFASSCRTFPSAPHCR